MIMNSLYCGISILFCIIIVDFVVIITERRPTLGCRLLVQREASKILPGAIRDLTDWSYETRIACASLLHLIALHCEDDNGTFQAPAMLEALLRAGADPEPLVFKPVRIPQELF